MTFGASIAGAFGANAWADVAWAGADGVAGKVVAGLPGLPPGNLIWSARGGGTMFSGGVLKAFSSGRGGADREGANDSVAGGDVTFAGGGPARRAAEGSGGEISLETTG